MVNRVNSTTPITARKKITEVRQKLSRTSQAKLDSQQKYRLRTPSGIIWLLALQDGDTDALYHDTVTTFCWKSQSAWRLPGYGKDHTYDKCIFEQSCNKANENVTKTTRSRVLEEPL